MDNDTIGIVEELTKELRDTVDEYLNGKVKSAYSSFKSAIELIKEILPVKPIHNRTFYRMRADGGITDEKEFYHLPLTKYIYLKVNVSALKAIHACIWAIPNVSVKWRYQVVLLQNLL